MGLFSYQDKYDAFLAEIDGVRISCSDGAEEKEILAKEIARAYGKKISDLAEFMLGEVCRMYGDMSLQDLIGALGVPLIDLDREIISYLEHTLDDYHIIDVEYSGVLDEFYEVIIDG